MIRWLYAHAVEGMLWWLAFTCLGGFVDEFRINWRRRA